MLQIAHLTLDSPFILAPLAGYTDLPFRRLCREFGAGLVVSEMISCHGLVYGCRQKKGKQQRPAGSEVSGQTPTSPRNQTLALLASHPAERPLALQLFGADPEIMGQAAALLTDYHPDLIDINMGCPVKKVTKKGAGAALMQEPELAETIIKQVIANSPVPVTVKTRIGVDSAHLSILDFARMIEDTGAAAITIHGRTWSQGFSGTANWEIIAAVKERLAIPVIGNGDIISQAHGLQMMRQTGCDGVMIGRAALGNPWVFSAAGKPQLLGPLLEGAFRYLELARLFLPDSHLPGYVKNHLGRYFKGLPDSSRYRLMIYACQTLPQLHQALTRMRDETTGERHAT